MSGENWTPGPWHVELGSEEDEGIVYVCHPKTMCDETVICAFADDTDKVANARLIAAAPELYDVLSELEESSAYWSEYFVPIGITERIKAALKKARGES